MGLRLDPHALEAAGQSLGKVIKSITEPILSLTDENLLICGTIGENRLVCIYEFSISGATIICRDGHKVPRNELIWFKDWVDQENTRLQNSPNVLNEPAMPRVRVKYPSDNKFRHSFTDTLPKKWSALSVEFGKLPFEEGSVLADKGGGYFVAANREEEENECRLENIRLTEPGGQLEAGNAAMVRGDYATALQLLRPLADAGNAQARSYLGFMYAEGRGLPENYAEAIKWLRLAAEQGRCKGTV